MSTDVFGEMREVAKRPTLSSAATVAGVTQTLDIVNRGADGKHRLQISLSDKSGYFGTFELSDDFPIGTALKYDLSTLGKQILQIDLMFRGDDGIGRYLHHLEAAPKRYLATISCWWFAEPSDKTIEEYFFTGTEAAS